MSKKVLSVILAISMVLTMCVGTFSVSAAGAGAVTISGGDADNLVKVTGKEFMVPVSISGNTEGFSTYLIKLIYDKNYVTPVIDPDYASDPANNADKSDLGLVQGDLGNVSYSNPTFGADTISVNTASARNIKGDGMLFGYKFIVNDSVNTSVSTDIRIVVEKLKYSGSGAQTPDREIAAIKNASVIINPNVTLTLSDLTTTYNGQAQGVTVNAPAGISYEVKYNGSTTKPTNAGTYPVTATVTQKGFTGTVSGSFKIEKEQIKVKADDKSMKIGDAAPDFTYTKTGGTLYGSDAIAGKVSCNYSNKVGTYKITKGTLAVPANYELIFTEGTLTVSDKIAQNVVVPELPAKTYGDAAFSWASTLDAASGITDVTYTSSNKDVATIDEKTGMVTVVGAGTTDLTVSVPGNADYAAFTATKKLTVNQVEITVTADDKTKRIGKPDPELTYTYTGTLVGEDKFTGALARTGEEEVGEYTITQGTLALNKNYKITFVPGKFTIVEKEPQTITVADFGKKTYGDAPFDVAVTPDAASGLTAFSYASSDERVATVSDEGKITIVGAGTVTITVAEAGNEEYAPVSVDKTLTIDPKALTIGVEEKTITYGDELGDFVVTYDGFIAGESEADLLTPVDSKISGVPDKLNAGTYTIKATGATSDNYAITFAESKLIVNKKDVKISTLGVFDKVYDGTNKATLNLSKLAFEGDNGFIDGDDVVINLADEVSALFADAEAGADKAVTISGFNADTVTFTGEDAKNYNVVFDENGYATTATIFAEGAATVEDAAAQIGDYIPVGKDDKVLTLPEVLPGYEVTIKSSNRPDIIDLEGNITRTNEVVEVQLVLFVQPEGGDGTTGVDVPVTVYVGIGNNKMVSTKIYGGNYGTLEGDIGQQPVGKELTVIAVPKSGYKITMWYVNGNAIGKASELSYTFVLEDDVEIGVRFEKITGGADSDSSGGNSGNTSVKTPTASVSSNSTVFKGTKIKLSTATSGAKIYYTTDGSAPTASNGEVYTNDGIRITGDTTIKAIAIKDSKKSNVLTVNYKMKTAKAEFKSNADKIRYMESVSDKLFAPDRAATRYEVLKALDEVMTIEDAKIENGFSDVTKEYEALVNKFAATSIIDGYPNKTFNGTGSITRAEFVKMLAAALNLDMSGTAKHDFKDVQSGHWAEKYIAAFAKLGYIVGDPDGSFRPDDNVTRAEVVTVLNRILKVEATPTATQAYTDLPKEHWAFGYIMAVAKDKE